MAAAVLSQRNRVHQEVIDARVVKFDDDESYPVMWLAGPAASPNQPTAWIEAVLADLDSRSGTR
jgi:hypothetical protein